MVISLRVFRLEPTGHEVVPGFGLESRRALFEHCLSKEIRHRFFAFSLHRSIGDTCFWSAAVGNMVAKLELQIVLEWVFLTHSHYNSAKTPPQWTETEKNDGFASKLNPADNHKSFEYFSLTFFSVLLMTLIT